MRCEKLAAGGSRLHATTAAGENDHTMIAVQEQYSMAECGEPRNMMYWKDFSDPQDVIELVATIHGGNRTNTQHHFSARKYRCPILESNRRADVEPIVEVR